MKKKSTFLFLLMAGIVLILSNCQKDESASYDLSKNGVPKFASHDFIDLIKVKKISRFRSGAGHSFTDAFESCRSMKHYFSLDSDWEPTQNQMADVYAPVAGTISKIEQEDYGNNFQVWIQSRDYPAFKFTIFHVNLAASAKKGETVNPGDLLGTTYGNDIAVNVQTSEGLRLISWFEVMTDPLFAQYQQRGILNRQQMIISKQERDSNPLQCSGDEQFPDQFATRDQDWIFLN